MNPPRLADVSVIVPTHNASWPLALSLPRILERVPAEHVWILDSDSRDGTPELARHHGCRVHGIPSGQFGHGRTRNLGVRLSREDGTAFFVFLTQDAVPEEADWLDRLLQPLREDAGIAATYARQLPRPEADPIETFGRVFNYPEDFRIQNLHSLPELGIKTYFLSDTCAAYRRSQFEAAGGFSEDVIVNEDMGIAEKFVGQGLSVRYSPEARVIHSHPLTPWEQFRRYFDIGVFMTRRPRLTRARPAHEGLYYARAQVAALWRSGRMEWLPSVFVDLCARYCGLQAGLRYRQLPAFLRPKLSRQTQFWDRDSTG